VVLVAAAPSARDELPGPKIAASPSLEVFTRRLVLLLAIAVGWFSLTNGERNKLSRLGCDSLARSDAES